MQTESNYSSLANHLRRIIPAYILGQIFAFLQIWPGIEFNNFSRELKIAGENSQDGTLKKVAKNFAGAGVLSIISFVCWLFPVIIENTVYYVSSHYGVDYGTLMQYASYGIPAIIGIIQTALLLSAWRQIQGFWANKDQQTKHLSGGVQATGRIIWAIQLSGFGYGLIVAGFVIVSIAFGLNRYTSLGPFLTGLGELLSLIGLINQGIGMGHTARAFQYLGQQHLYQKPSISVAPIYAPTSIPTPQPQYQPQSQMTPPVQNLPPKMRFCPGCGSELPQSPDLKFCPTCG
jgi:hypothetical protein